MGGSEGFYLLGPISTQPKFLQVSAESELVRTDFYLVSTESELVRTVFQRGGAIFAERLLGGNFRGDTDR